MAGGRNKGKVTKVANLDFSVSALAIGRVNAELNGFGSEVICDASSGTQRDINFALRAEAPTLR
jgi:hypothetical protein